MRRAHAWQRGREISDFPLCPATTGGAFRSAMAPARRGFAVPAETPKEANAVNQRTAKIFEVHDEDELRDIIEVRSCGATSMD
jgi:hypothetical protein